jgi:ribosomal-protein-alanine N-acetyltransferase
MMALECQSPAAGHWAQNQYEALFVATSGPEHSERLAWVAEDEAGALDVLAFLVAHRVDTEWELENIVVAETARRRGVGARLVNELIAHVQAVRGGSIFLEVRRSNQSARSLYRKAGFEETGLRKSYYADPPEDAVLCRLRIY